MVFFILSSSHVIIVSINVVFILSIGPPFIVILPMQVQKLNITRVNNIKWLDILFYKI